MYLQLTSVVSSDPDSMCSRSTQVKTSPKSFFHYNINGELKNVAPSVFAFAVLEATSPCPVHPALPSFSTHPLLLLLPPDIIPPVSLASESAQCAADAGERREEERKARRRRPRSFRDWWMQPASEAPHRQPINSYIRENRWASVQRCREEEEHVHCRSS